MADDKPQIDRPLTRECARARLSEAAGSSCSFVMENIYIYIYIGAVHLRVPVKKERKIEK